MTLSALTGADTSLLVDCRSTSFQKKVHSSLQPKAIFLSKLMEVHVYSSSNLKSTSHWVISMEIIMYCMCSEKIRQCCYLWLCLDCKLRGIPLSNLRYLAMYVTLCGLFPGWRPHWFVHSFIILFYNYINGAFTLPDSDKVYDSDNITVHSYGTHIKIGNKIGIGSVSVNRP